MTISRIGTHLITLAAALVLAGCGGSSSNDTVEPADGEIQYAPLAGLVPSPNDLAFQGSTDGTLNTSGESAVDAAVNSIDGFSTNTSATLTATVPLDGSTITPGDTVRVFAVETNGDPNSTTTTGPDDAGPKAVTQLTRTSVNGVMTRADLNDDGVLEPGTEYTAGLSSADRNGRTLAVTPLRPLKSDQTYMVVVTNGVQERGGGAINASQQYRLTKRTSPLADASGNSTVDSLSDKEAQSLEPVRRLVNSQLGVATGATSIAREDIVASWTFTTQTTGKALTEVRNIIQNGSPVFADARGKTDQLTDTGRDTPTEGTSAGNVFAGVLSGVPYYLEPGDSDPKKVRTSFWTQSDGTQLVPGSMKPARNDTLNIPVLAAIPKDANDVDGNDVVIFQHGIRSNRTAMLGIANTLTAQGLTVIAIDLPLHGITNTGSGLYQSGNERTFDVDLVDNDGSSGPDGEIDPSGEHFINLSSLRSSRDNLRQSVSDLFAVTRAIRLTVSNSDGDLDGDGDADLSNNISFLGHSLGGIVGVPYTAKEGDLDAAVYGMAGSGIAKLLDGSPTIGPRIEAGLEANGLSKGTPAYEQFLAAAQTVIDKGDPANYAGPANIAGTAAANHNTLSLEVVGGSSFPADQVVPNNLVKPFQQGVPDGTIPSPTAGTDPLARLLTGAPVNQIDSNPALESNPSGDYLIRYTAGDHASLLSPEASSAATSEMQSNVASFIVSDGTSVSFIGSGTVDSP